MQQIFISFTLFQRKDGLIRVLYVKILHISNLLEPALQNRFFYDP